jgi:hypothetical protein
MKSYFIFTALFVALSFLGCQDSKEDAKTVQHDLDFYKNVGEQIAFETGMQWREFYERKNSEQGRLSLSNFELSEAQLDALLGSVATLVGVAFHYGIDENGTTHIIAIAVDESLSLWTYIPGRLYIDTNTGNTITQNVASTWAESFKSENPSGIWFHFFGETTFEEIASISYFDTIEISPAINIFNLQPQMLLIVWNDLNLLGGRTSSEDRGGSVYDASYPCPPCGIQ